MCFNYQLLLITLIFLLDLDFVTSQNQGRDEYDYDRESHQFYKSGEFNDRCRSTRDCRQFGYVCRDNRTCQCDYMYIPDAKRRLCVGGVNQRCVYDEHCIEGAFCMNQAVCKCKDTTPIELEDGLLCSGLATTNPSLLLLLSLLSVLGF